MVRVHPLTGERGLFIGGFAQRIVGLSKGESHEHPASCCRHYVTRPENILRVAWEPGQLVLFDNRITQHYAVDNYDDAPRRLNRVTVAGDIPVGIDGSQQLLRQGRRLPLHPGRRRPRRGLSSTQPQRTPRESSAARFACTDATARNASRR